MVRIVTSVLVFVVLGLFVDLTLGSDISRNISTPLKKCAKNLRRIKYPSELGINDEVSAVEGTDADQGINIEEQDKSEGSAKARHGRRGKPIPLEIFKGEGDADAYFISFREASDSSAKYESNLPKERLAPKIAKQRRATRSLAIPKININDILKKRFVRDANPLSESIHEHQFNVEKEVAIAFNKADEIASAIFKSSESISKSLGICRKTVSTNFVSLESLTETQSVIDAIVNQLRNSLEETMGCRTCITPHPDILEFLKWLLHDETSLKCCKTRPKSSGSQTNYLLFNHDNKDMSPLTKISEECRPVSPTPSTQAPDNTCDSTDSKGNSF